MAQATAEVRGADQGVWDAREHQRRLQWRFVGYISLSFVTLPFVLPVWNRVLVNSIGRFVSVEQLHVVQFSVLGWLAGRYAGTFAGVRGWLGLTLLGGVLGLLDEALQRWLPGRFFDWADVGLNVAGLALGLGLCAMWDWRKRAVSR